MIKAVDWDVKQQNKQTNIKGNGECSNMQTHILSLHSLGWVQRSKQLFFESSHVAYQINWNGA